MLHKITLDTKLHETPLTIQELFLTEYEFSGFIKDGAIVIWGAGAYLADNRVQIPIPIKPIPEISFMVFAETNLSSSEPITTAKKVARVNAHDAAARIPQRFISLLVENRSVEICVLSPISARNVMKKTVR